MPDGINISSGFQVDTSENIDIDYIQATLITAAAIPPERLYDGKPIFVTDGGDRGRWNLDADLINWSRDADSPGTWWELAASSVLNYPATGAASFTAVDGITNAIDITGQLTAETFDFLAVNILDTGRTSSGDANFLRFQNDGANVYSLDVIGNSLATSYSFIGDSDSKFYRKGVDNVAIATGGIDAINIDASQNVSMSPDTDATTIMGKARFHSVGTDIAYFSHYDFTADTDYSIQQNSAGRTLLNSVAGQTLNLMQGNVSQWYLDSGGDLIGLLGNALTLGNKADPDPTGANGMLYYNSTNNKFRAYENSAWVDLIGGGAGWALTGTSTLTGDVIISPGANFIIIGDTGVGVGNIFLDDVTGDITFRSGAGSLMQLDTSEGEMQINSLRMGGATGSAVDHNIKVGKTGVTGDGDLIISTIKGGTFAEAFRGTDAGIQLSGDATQIIKTVNLQLSSAQILALNTTPITIISAPGAGKKIQIIGASAFLNYNTTAYATTSDIILKYAASGTTIWTTSGSNLLTGTADKSSTFSQSSTLQSINSSIDIQAPTADPTLGNSTVDVYIQYVIIDTN